MMPLTEVTSNDGLGFKFMLQFDLLFLKKGCLENMEALITMSSNF